MKNIVDLDVLVVYSAGIAQSASDSDPQSIYPFPIDGSSAACNAAYAYFLRTCRQLGLKAGFASSQDIVGPGTCSSYWTYANSVWTKVDQLAHSSFIFDKLSPTSPVRRAERKLLLSSPQITPFNDVDLFKQFFDKLDTFEAYPLTAIPTVALELKSITAIRTKVAELSLLLAFGHHPLDFIPNQFVLKDRFGAGGKLIFQIKHDHFSQIRQILLKHPHNHFVLQPFMAFDRGFSYHGVTQPTDIRLIFHKQKLIQSYTRTAVKGDFRCNVGQGGACTYLSNKEIPARVLQSAKRLLYQVNKPNELFALDFLITNPGNVYFLEGNMSPGIYWNSADLREEAMTKLLIRQIVQEIARRVRQTKISVKLPSLPVLLPTYIDPVAV